MLLKTVRLFGATGLDQDNSGLLFIVFLLFMKQFLISISVKGPCRSSLFSLPAVYFIFIIKLIFR